jgi:hypothetical protein
MGSQFLGAQPAVIAEDIGESREPSTAIFAPLSALIARAIAAYEASRWQRIERICRSGLAAMD